MSVHQIPPETDDGDDEFEEPENVVLRRELGLRPVGYQRAATTQTSARARRGAGLLTRASTSTRWTSRHPLEALHVLEPALAS